jgi:large subunit ribosomal protein L7/L12
MVGGAAPAAGGAEAAEEKANWTVVLASGGANKIAAIKAVREILPDLGLKEAKDLVDGAPKTVKDNVPTEEAKAMKADIAKLQEKFDLAKDLYEQEKADIEGSRS